MKTTKRKVAVKPIAKKKLYQINVLIPILVAADNLTEAKSLIIDRITDDHENEVGHLTSLAVHAEVSTGAHISLVEQLQPEWFNKVPESNSENNITCGEYFKK